MLGRDKGRVGERSAEAHLIKAGLELIERNYNCRSGEIDLVMLDRRPDDHDVLTFVEVRLRGHHARVSGIDSIDQHKQQRLIRAAQHFLMSRPEWQEHPCRFDVVGMMPDGKGLQWISGAFEAA